MAIKKVKKVQNEGILAIDQSLNGSACVFRNGGKMIKRYMTDKRKNMTSEATLVDIKKINEFERMELIESWFTGILESVKPKFVVLEGYAFGGTGRAFQLGELGGMLRMILWKGGYNFMIIPPDSVKLFATGKGNATKSMMIASAIVQHGIDFSVYAENGEDLADAFWLNRMIETILEVKENPKLLKKLPEHQRRAISEKKGKGKNKMPTLLETEFVCKG